MMGEITYYPEVVCEVRSSGFPPGGVSAVVKDFQGSRQFVQVTRELINESEGVSYLSVGIVEVDRHSRRAMIELPVEADSGFNRMWVNFDSLRREAVQAAGVVA